MINEIPPETKYRNNAPGTTEQSTPPDNMEQQAAAQQTESGRLATAWSYIPSFGTIFQYFFKALHSLLIIRNIVFGTTDQQTVENAEQQVAAQETERSRGILVTAKSYLCGLVPKIRSYLSGSVPKPPSLRPISQSSFLELDENNYKKEIIYRETQTRNTKTPAIVNFTKPGYTICGIACAPRDSKTSSPEVEIESGGLGCDHVKLRLTPVYSGLWASCVEIVGYKHPKAITQADDTEIDNTALTPVNREREAANKLY